MEIKNYFECDNREHWFNEIKRSEWAAGTKLAEFLESGKFHETLGEGMVLMLIDGDKLVSYVTFSFQDCVDDKAMYPWIGFVFTAPEYRGHRYAGQLIERCEEIARGHSVKNIYICTDHEGLYEKYGYSYLENRVDIYGDDSRIYVKNITKERSL